MGCNCGKKKLARESYLVTFTDGTRRTYTTEMDAKRAVATKGGSYKKV